jgi:hypothetical protein
MPKTRRTTVDRLLDNAFLFQSQNMESMVAIGAFSQSPFPPWHVLQDHFQNRLKEPPKHGTTHQKAKLHKKLAILSSFSSMTLFNSPL